MKNPPPITSSPTSAVRRVDGIALILVLASLVILSALVLAFFASVNSSRNAASQYSNSLTTKLLSDTAVNVVIGQLQKATENTGGTTVRAWASQPGAIRTFNLNGSLNEAYKLYSDWQMIETDPTKLDPAKQPADAAELKQWDTKPAFYVDLNEPAQSGGKLCFPIVDPRAMTVDSTKTVEGFGYDSDAVNGAVAPSSTQDDQRIPMPTKWLYILANGQLITPKAPGVDGAIADFSNNSAVLTPTNPIVGRIAFWTDDETCKINVNTASEAIPWDVPRCTTADDKDYAAYLPVKHEVQRYPGHPATTCLSSVFFPNEYLDPSKTADISRFQDIYTLVPRVATGGYLESKSKTPITYDSDRLYASYDDMLFRTSRIPDPNDSTRTIRDRNPLLTTVGTDQLRQSAFFLTTTSRAPELNLFGLPRISLWPVSVPPTSSEIRRTGFDETIAFCSTINGYKYFFERNRDNIVAKAGATGDLDLSAEYTKTPRNFDLYKYLSNLASRAIPGSGGGNFRSKYLQNDNSGLGSVSNIDFSLMNMLDQIRITNQQDNTKVAASQVLPYSYSAKSGSELALGEIGGIIPNKLTALSTGTQIGALKEANVQKDTWRTWRTFGRFYSPSEFAFIFSCPAWCEDNGTTNGIHHGPDEYFADGATTSPNNLKLAPGERAIEVCMLGEGFCPAQGYVMAYPDIELETSARTAWGPRGTVKLYKSASGMATNYAPALWWDFLTHTPFTTQSNADSGRYICAGGTYPTRPASFTSGWGGSGGPHMFMCLDAAIDAEVRPRGMPGFFKVSASDTSLYVGRIAYSVRIRQGVRQWAGTGAGQGTEVNLYIAKYEPPIKAGELEGFFTIPMPQLTDLDCILTGGSTLPNRGLYSRINTSSASSAATDLLLRQIITGSTDGKTEKNVVRSFVMKDSDYRISSLWKGADDTSQDGRQFFTPHPLFLDPTVRMAHSLTTDGGIPLPGATFAPTPVTGVSRGLVKGLTYPAAAQPDFPITPVAPAGYIYPVDPTDTRDWDNGTGICPDGAYINKPDDGGFDAINPANPYFQHVWDSPAARMAGQEMLSPNRLIPSAVQFGSLPSAPLAQTPWTTFLFRPDLTPLNPTTPTGGHLGSAKRSIASKTTTAPPDHLLLDWFWLPIVEPYAISETFSTAGKTNLNYQILPFSYIKRATGLHAVLKSEKLLAIPDSGVSTYKTGAGGNWRHHIDATQTLLQFQEKFDNNQIFRTASEICEQFLVPLNEGIAESDAAGIRSAMTTYWSTHRLSGDNTLERPYANIYPRLTTRSNTYTVHYRVQLLKVAPSRSKLLTFVDPASTAVGIKDQIVGEYRGSTTIERYLDVSDPLIPDYLTNLAATETLDKHYKYRILSTKGFAQ